MPAILPPAAFDSWLAGNEMALAPWPDGALTLRPVSPLVNKATSDDPWCVEPVARQPGRAKFTATGGDRAEDG